MRRGGAKWAGAPKGAIAAGVADMELGTPSFVIDAVIDEVRRGGGYAAPDSAPVSSPCSSTTSKHPTASSS